MGKCKGEHRNRSQGRKREGVFTKRIEEPPEPEGFLFFLYPCVAWMSTTHPDGLAVANSPTAGSFDGLPRRCLPHTRRLGVLLPCRVSSRGPISPPGRFSRSVSTFFHFISFLLRLSRLPKLRPQPLFLLVFESTSETARHTFLTPKKQKDPTR